jgi:hypothetical protein
VQLGISLTLIALQLIDGGGPPSRGVGVATEASPLPPPPPPPTTEDDSLDVASAVTFAALSLDAFDDATFASLFRVEFVTTLARAAGVEPWRVEVTGVAAGSVVVSSVVRFAPTAVAPRDALEAALASAPATLFVSSATLGSQYGAITATLPPPLGQRVDGVPPPAQQPPPAPRAPLSTLPNLKMLPGGPGWKPSSQGRGLMQRCQKWRLVTGGRSLTRPFREAPDFPRHDCSPYRGLHGRRESLGFVPRSGAIFCRPVPNVDDSHSFSIAAPSLAHYPIIALPCPSPMVRHTRFAPSRGRAGSHGGGMMQRRMPGARATRPSGAPTGRCLSGAR